MSSLSGIDIALLKKLSMINSLDRLECLPSFTFIQYLKQLCSDWDDVILEKSWQTLVSQKFVKDIPLKVNCFYNKINRADDVLTDEGIRAASKYFG